MLWAVSHCCSTAAAWAVGCSFIRAKRLQAAIVLLPAALLCGIVAYAMDRMSLLRWCGLAELALFLLAAGAVWLGRGRVDKDIWLALLLAQGSKVLLDLIGDSALTAIGTAGLSVSLVAPGMWVGICAALSRYFPDQNWREAVRCGYASMGQTKLNARQVDGLTAVLCLLLTAVCWANGVEGGLAVAGWWLVGGCLYWGGVMLAALLIAFQKERGTVLAEQQYRQEMQSFLNVIRSQRHDYNFHVQTIAGLIQEGKMDECRQYVSALEQDSIRMNAVLPVQDPAIAAMIHNFQVLAARDGIELHVDIQNDLARIATNVYETNKIISNLLQNAIDETVTHEDRCYGIWLTILKRGEYCVIRVSNELGEAKLTMDELGRIYQQGYSTKRGHDGVGLSSIKALAARYRGTVYTQLEGNVIHFVAKIPINYAKEPVEER